MTDPRTRDGDRLLFRRAGLTIGEFVCPPESTWWRCENTIGNWHLVVFPRLSVEIQQSGRTPVIADPNHVILYNANQPYRRRLLDRRGDAVVFFALETNHIAEIVGGFDPSVRDRLDAPFPWDASLIPTSTYLRHAQLVRTLAVQASCEAGDRRDTLAVDEAALEFVEEALRVVFTARGQDSRLQPTPGQRQHTRRRHRDQVFCLRGEIAKHFQEPRSLEQLAAGAELSAYHAARLFRRHTGMSMHAYRTSLRLRASLELLAEGPSGGLTAIALALGFSSHSHFTTAFRNFFGVPPSQIWAQRSAHLDKRRHPAPSH